MLIWEWSVRGGELRITPWFLPLLAWGYLQYRLVGNYRLRRGGGGPVGHMIFLAGLTLVLHSALAALITLATIVWFQLRVRRDERRLEERFGPPYVEYKQRVKRWLPGLF